MINSHALRGAHRALAWQTDHKAVADIPPVGFEKGLLVGPKGQSLGPPIQLAAQQVRDSPEHHHPVPYRVGC